MRAIVAAWYSAKVRKAREKQASGAISAEVAALRIKTLLTLYHLRRNAPRWTMEALAQVTEAPQATCECCGAASLHQHIAGGITN